MPGDTEDLDLTPEDDSGFDSGFTGESQTTTPDDEPETNAEVNEPVDPPAPRYAQITEEQFADLMAKASSVDQMKAETSQKLNQAFGQLGGLKQRLEYLQGTTGAGQPVQVSEDLVSEMRAEFPELADLNLKAFQKFASSLKGTGSPDIERIVSERVSATQADLTNSRLDEVVDGDWQAEVKTPAFTEWLSRQQDDVKALAASNAIRDASRMLRLYVRDKSAPPPPPPAPATTRQRQLAAAVNPKSSGGKPSVTTVEDEFDAGFRSR